MLGKRCGINSANLPFIAVTPLMSCLVCWYLPLRMERPFFLRFLRRRLPLVPLCLLFETTTTFGDAVPKVVGECCAEGWSKWIKELSVNTRLVLGVEKFAYTKFNS